MAEWTDSNTLRRMIGEIVEKELNNLDRIMPEHLAGNKYRAPRALREWMQRHAENTPNDQVYRHMLGYGWDQFSVEWLFREDSITMTFFLPDGTRMFMLEILGDA